MHRSNGALVFLTLVVVLAMPCTAQSIFDGRCGVFDDREMLHDFGTMVGPSKSIWIGVPLGGSLDDGYTGFEFSISGLEVFSHFELRFPLEPTVRLGSVAAPTDTITGTGGINVAWPSCQDAGLAFLEIVLYSSSPPENHVLRVFRRFPPTNPSLPYPLATHCDGPCFCPILLQGGSYVLNPTVAVEPTSWGAVKQLYSGEYGELVPGPVHR